MSATTNHRRLIKPIEFRCSFWFQWVLVTFLGFLVSLYWIEIGERPDIRLVEGAIAGAVIGVAQWSVLRQHFSQAWWWILISIVSWGLLGGSGVGAFGWVAPTTPRIVLRVVYGAVYGAITGAGIGVAQWLFFRRQVEKAGQWILASTVSWAIALVFGWTIGGIFRLLTGIFLAEVVGLTVVWILVAAMTGLALCRMAGSTLEN
jgi:hypothetical protein